MADGDADSMSGSTALVTGGRGFIGSHLCRHLATAGARVHVVSRRPAGPTSSEITHTVDLADEPAVGVLIDAVRPDYVFHLASHVDGTRDLAAVGPTFRNNLATTVNLLEHVARVGCRRMVIAGSLETPQQDEPPSSPYAAAKAAAQMYGRMFWQLYQTPVVTARIFMVYGPGQRDDRKLVPYVTKRLLAGNAPRLTSGVRPVDWVYVDDVAETLMRCATTPGLVGRSVDVGTGRLTTVRSVVEQLSRLIRTREPVFGTVDDRPLEQVRAADPAAAVAMLGRELTGLERGLEETVAWYREHD